MSELGDYRRLVEKPAIANYETTIASLRSENERLREALQQLVDYVKDGCPDDGRYYVMTEAQAELKGISVVPAAQAAELKRHKRLENHDVMVARGEAEPL